MGRLEKLQPYFKWILLSGIILTLIVWFSVFRMRDSFTLEDVAIEGMLLVFVGIMYILVLRFKAPILEMGIGFYFYGLLIDFLDEFTKEPDIVNTTAEGLIKILGLFLIVFGLFRIYSHFDEELRMGKEREDAVRRSEQKYRILAESSNDAIFLIDSSGMFTYLNQYGADLFDISPEAVLGKTLEGIFSPPSAGEFQEAVGEARTTGKPSSREIMVSIGNRDFWMESRFIPIKDDGDIPGITMGIARDITARKRDEVALRQAHRKLNLLSSITRHDVLNQLTVLMGYHALMKENTDDPQVLDMLENIGGVEDTIERMISFTRDYQDIGVNSPLWQSIREKTTLAYQQLNNRQFTLEIPEKDYEVFADPLLERVFLNLMDNTVRHGEYAKKIVFSFRDTDQGLTIIYEDDGIGIPDSEKEQIFNQKYGKNSGFGLFLSKEILSITGIKIKEDGVYRKGIRFEMSVPRDIYRRI